MTVVYCVSPSFFEFKWCPSSLIDSVILFSFKRTHSYIINIIKISITGFMFLISEMTVVLQNVGVGLCGLGILIRVKTTNLIGITNVQKMAIQPVCIYGPPMKDPLRMLYYGIKRLVMQVRKFLIHHIILYCIVAYRMTFDEIFLCKKE